MLDTLSTAIQQLCTALYSSLDRSIVAVCGFVWTDILPYTVGIVVGLASLKMYLDDDLNEGFKKFLFALFPLFIIAWLVQPGSRDGCRVVSLKNDILAVRTKLTNIVAPDFAGPPAALITNTVSRMNEVNADLLDSTVKSLIPRAEVPPAKPAK